MVAKKRLMTIMLALCMLAFIPVATASHSHDVEITDVEKLDDGNTVDVTYELHNRDDNSTDYNVTVNVTDEGGTTASLDAGTKTVSANSEAEYTANVDSSSLTEDDDYTVDVEAVYYGGTLTDSTETGVPLGKFFAFFVVLAVLGLMFNAT